MKKTAKAPRSRPAAARKPTTVAALLAGLPPERARELTAVREALLPSVPDGYEEAAVNGMIVWQVPLARYSDTYNGHPLWLAALGAPKSYLTLHLVPVYGSPKLLEQLTAGFRKAGKRLDIGKACLRFHRADDLALDAISRVIAAMPVDKWVAIAEAARHRKARA